jgi:hypothetical protein
MTAIILLLGGGSCPLTDVVHLSFKVTAERRWRRKPAPLGAVAAMLVTIAGSGLLPARLPAGVLAGPSDAGLAPGLVLVGALALAAAEVDGLLC